MTKDIEMKRLLTWENLKTFLTIAVIAAIVVYAIL